ncbi:hypothetical protein H310_02392 [Aphanomyces invadans]|uniref:ABC-2 type transporter domain-containing protein n=1 Tax=Aphanomyces invadans TaxID=157072 RepID=A0A024UNZ4_9STRA|nr:hypothetical protein H310_02392 [Aphanomyces invadans]ETW08014.1 hypothetical protein H310_02392 [Aphanomyces invadans]|eukprot:XP_008864107.1 hypothetical protein H310_02392 [Aphanomyces invadans]
MTMLQPPPEVYNMFDNVLVLDKGEVVYNGPRTTLPSYFRSIGFECPPRKDIADFLQELTTHLGPRALFRELDSNVSVVQANDHLPSVPPRVALRYRQCMDVAFRRTLKASLRDVATRMGQSVVLGAVLGTVFLDVGLFFLAILFQVVTTLSAIDAGIALRKVLYDQMASYFFWTYTMSEGVAEVLWTIPQVILFATSLYFNVGLHASAASFVMCAAVLFLASVTYAQFFKFFTAIAPDVVIAKVIAIFAFFLHVVFSGYILPEDKIPAPWR